MIISKRRSRTSSKYIYYALQLYFSGYHFEKHRKGYLNLSQGTTFPFGIGFSATNQRRYSKGDANYLNIIDETLITVGNQYAWL
jgi:hypothetical protein